MGFDGLVLTVSSGWGTIIRPKPCLSFFRTQIITSTHTYLQITTLQVATDSLGDMEVLDALIAREKYYARIGDKAAALKAADDVSRRLVSSACWSGLMDHIPSFHTHADFGQAQDLDGEED